MSTLARPRSGKSVQITAARRLQKTSMSYDFSGVSRRRQQKNELPFNAAREYLPCCGCQ